MLIDHLVNESGRFSSMNNLERGCSTALCNCRGINNEMWNIESQKSKDTTR